MNSHVNGHAVLNLGLILSPVIDMQELKQLKVKDQGLELNILPYVCTHVGSGLCIHTVYTLTVPSLSQGRKSRSMRSGTKFAIT